MGESLVISLIAVVLVLIVLAALIVKCFRQKDVENTSRPWNRRGQRRYINRGGQMIVLSEFSSFIWHSFLIKIKVFTCIILKKWHQLITRLFLRR
ncbi:hypothetical protein BDFB_005782 [Asbolus verrucosus]|uniref:Uncharacterized protein n=1 Tax=Asbolus verrucosus TaxID=1661398 RepID=A0A482V689_ASBVE|nr:hypothetical protein BDFB_005782 [Asbolus verrucosus]